MTTPETRSGLLMACRNLFARYPQAAEVVSHDGTLREMTLIVAGGHDARHFVLSCQDKVPGAENDGPFYCLSRQCGEEYADLSDETVPVPGWAVEAVIHGTPLPRDGSLRAASNPRKGTPQ